MKYNDESKNVSFKRKIVLLCRSSVNKIAESIFSTNQARHCRCGDLETWYVWRYFFQKYAKYVECDYFCIALKQA